MTEHKSDSEEKSVEQNLSNDYVSKEKLGNLPVSNKINDALKEKMDKTQKEIEEFKIEITKKIKGIEAIGIIPAQAAKKIEEEYEISEADSKRELIHILTVIPEKQFKNIGKIRLEAIALAKKINEKFWIHVMTPVDIWNLGLDSKFEVFEAISMSFPILDKGLLSSLRVCQIHKSMVLKKFEKYVSSYIIYGSITRGQTIKTSDVDVAIIIDDTDVKRMPRLELKEKLRGIIYSYIAEAEAIAGVKNVISPQIWLMTEFWDGVKDAHPVFFTCIRDGVPAYDRGNFLPWKSLLRMGKIKPSPEAIDMFMSSGEKIKEIVNKRIFDIATLDLFWNVFTPAQGLLMLYGQHPKNHRETVKAFKETFVDKEKLIEQKYADILEEIVIKIYKGMEHNLIKPGDINGKELDRLTKDAIDFFARLKELREQIEKRVQEKSIEAIYKDVFGMLGALLKEDSEEKILQKFNKTLIKEGKFPPRFLESLKFVAKTRREIESAKKIKTKKKENLTFKQSLHVDEARKLATEIINALIEHTQRCDLAAMEKSRYIIKGKNMDAEVFFLGSTFILQGSKIQKLSKEKLVNSDVRELQDKILANKGKETKIDFKALETLKKIFGEFELIQ